MKRCDQRKGKGEGKVMWGDFRDQERAGGRTRGGGQPKSSSALLLPCQRWCRFRLCGYKYA